MPKARTPSGKSPPCLSKATERQGQGTFVVTNKQERDLVGERLQFRRRRCNDYIPGARTGMQCHVSWAGRQLQVVDSLNEVALLVIHQNAAAAGRIDTGESLADKEQLMDGIELHVAAAEHLVVCVL